MAEVKVQAGQSILEGYAEWPSIVLPELSWNAFDDDRDAHLVAITCGCNAPAGSAGSWRLMMGMGWGP